MNPIRSGPLRHRITIQQPAQGAPDSFGGRQNVFTTFATVWGSIAPLSGREMDYARGFDAQVSHRVIMRYVAGILPSFRILYGSRTFSITAALNAEERNRMLTLYCTELIAT